jgi:hypothetical protein
MRVFTAVVEIATLAVVDPGQDIALRRAVALQLIRDDDPRYIPQALEQLAKKLLRGLLVAATLHQDVEHVIVLIHGAPQVMTLPVDRHKHLVQMPLVTGLGASTLQLIRIGLPRLPTPLTDGVMGHGDATLAQEFLHIAVAQGKPIVALDPMADDFAGKRSFVIRAGGSALQARELSLIP